MRRVHVLLQPVAHTLCRYAHAAPDAHGLIGGFPHGKGGKQTVLQGRHFEFAACFLEQRDVDLMQPSDKKSRSLRQRPRAVFGLDATFFCLPQRTLPALKSGSR